jgi:WD40 repeat protein
VEATVLVLMTSTALVKQFAGSDRSAAMRPVTQDLRGRTYQQVYGPGWLLLAIGFIGLFSVGPALGQAVKKKAATAVAPAAVAPAIVAAAMGEPADYDLKPDSVLLTSNLFSAAVMSPDGALAAGGTSDWTKPGDLLLWDVASRQIKFQLQLRLGVHALAFSPDNRFLAAGSFTNEVVVVDVKKAAVVARWAAHQAGVNGLAFSPDSKLLATASLDRTVKLFDVLIPSQPTGQLPLRTTLEGHFDWVLSLVFSVDGKTLYSTGRDKKIFAWDVKKQQALMTWDDLPAAMECLAVSPDGKAIACGSWKGMVELRSTADGRVLKTVKPEAVGQFVSSVSFAKSSPLFAAATSDGTILIWDLSTGMLATTIEAHQGKAWAVALSPDGSEFMSAGSDGMLWMWDAKTKKQKFQLQQQQGTGETNSPIVTSTLSRDRTLLITGHADSSIRVRDAKTGRTLKLAAKTSGPLAALALSPDKKLLIAAGPGPAVSTWDISGEIGAQRLLKGHTAAVTSVAISADGKSIFSGATDGQVRQWNAASGAAGLELEAGQEAISSLGCAEDGSWLAAGHGQKISLWNLSHLERKPAFTLSGHQTDVTTLTFATQQSLLASADDDNMILLWNLIDLKQQSDPKSAVALKPRTFVGHQASITSLAFSPNGSMLASSSQDKTVRLWSVESGQPLQILVGNDFIQLLAFNADASDLLGVSRDKTLKTWHGQQLISFPATEGRYIKLKALSEITGGPCTVVAEIRVLQKGAFVSQRQWQLVSVDSQVATLPATLAFDGKPQTHWHTPYQGDVTKLPHQIVIDLGQTCHLTGLSVLHRSDVWAPNGSIKEFEFYAGNDPNDFGPPVSKGEFKVRIPQK